MVFILRTIVITLAILLTAELLPGIEVDNFTSALIAAFLLGVVNAVIKPVAVILTLPITVLTLGLFYLVINALFFIMVASLVSGFEVHSFGAAFLGSLIVSIITSLVAPKDN